MLSASIEDYIKAIYGLERDHGTVGTKRIAQRLGVRMASVTGMIKHLAAEGYVRHKPYYGVQLTEKGRSVALNLIRRHRLLELFLARTLRLSWDEVHADAEVLEHVVSNKLIDRIYEHLGRPEFDPHGSPIPGSDGSLPDHRGVPLDELPVGVRARVLEVSDYDPELLRYLTNLKIKIGSGVRVRDRAPFNGPITLQVGSRTVSIGRDACRRILVREEHGERRRTAGR